MKGVAFDVCGSDAATEVSTADEQRELLLGEGRKASAHINHKVFATVSTGSSVGAPAGASEVWPGTQRGKFFDHVSGCL